MTFDPHRSVVVRVVVVVILALAFGFAASPSAQEDRRVGVEEDSLETLGRQLKSFSPRLGPPGTVVTLQAGDLPIRAPLRVGVGALRLGFEEAGWILSGEDGEFTFELEIPSWATHDMSLFFIAFDPYFKPLALSQVFHVTGPEGTVLRHGRIARDDGGCPTLNGPDRLPYALVGDVDELEPGTEVTVEGRIAERSVCGERTTIHVVRVQRGA